MNSPIANSCAGTDPGLLTAGTDPGRRYWFAWYPRKYLLYKQVVQASFSTINV